MNFVVCSVVVLTKFVVPTKFPLRSLLLTAAGFKKGLFVFVDKFEIR